MNVYACGTPVKLLNSDCKGYITAILITGEQVSYEVSYFKENEYQKNFFQDFELLTARNEETVTIGFAT